MVSAKSAEQEKTLQDRLEHPQQENPSGGGRHAAGEDPVKRERILDGAKRVFMRSSFDAASMNDITREAGVSKGTLYVYFENKEDLFTALIARERNIIVNSVKQSLNGNEPIEEALHAFGVKLVTSITSDYTIRAMRTVLGVIDRMPGWRSASSLRRRRTDTPCSRPISTSRCRQACSRSKTRK